MRIVTFDPRHVLRSRCKWDNPSGFDHAIVATRYHCETDNYHVTWWLLAVFQSGGCCLICAHSNTLTWWTQWLTTTTSHDRFNFPKIHNSPMRRSRLEHLLVDAHLAREVCRVWGGWCRLDEHVCEYISLSLCIYIYTYISLSMYILI